MGTLILREGLAYWLLLFFSALNVFLSLWLGLAVVMNAEQRNWGVRIAGSGLILGGIAFIGHILAVDGALFDLLTYDLIWFSFWTAAALQPLFWYLTMLWFAGYWERADSRLRRRHRPWFIASLVATFLFLSVVYIAGRPLLNGGLARYTWPETMPVVAGLPLVILLYPLLVLLTIAPSLDALTRMERTGWVMGDIARGRARRLLLATTLLLLAVGAAVSAGAGATALWMDRPLPFLLIAQRIVMIDVLLSIAVGVSIVMLGEAIVTYEIFTGTILPSGGLRRQWRRALGVALLLAAAAATAGVRPLPFIAVTLLGLVAAALVYALYSRRSFRERERFLEGVRPFIEGVRMLDLVEGKRGGDDPTRKLFTLLCTDLLGGASAALIPAGASAGLAGAPLVHPPDAPIPRPDQETLDLIARGDEMGIPLVTDGSDGALWGMALRSASGLGGTLLLGQRADGGLFTREVLEVARAACERLLDARAGAELSRRLAELHRRRLTENRLLDASTRRRLHDDILPQVQTLMIRLSPEERASHGDSLSELHRSISDLLRSIPPPGALLLERTDLTGALRTVLEGELAGSFDDVRLRVGDSAAELAGRLERPDAETLFYAAREAMRNAARHGRGGRPERPLHLDVALDRTSDGRLRIAVTDDGVGRERADLSTRGGGAGLELHETLLAVMGGSLAVESRSGGGTVVTILSSRSFEGRDGERSQT